MRFSEERFKNLHLSLDIFAAIMFLVEGAVLDWGALITMDRHLLAERNSGLGYLMFSVAKVFGRLTGDRTVTRLGARKGLIWGGVTAIAALVAIVPLFAGRVVK